MRELLVQHGLVRDRACVNCDHFTNQMGTPHCGKWNMELPADKVRNNFCDQFQMTDIPF